MAMNTAEKIIRILSMKQIKQSVLARKTSLSFVSVNRIVNGHQQPTPETLKKIADALNVPVSDFADNASDAEDNAQVCGYIEYGGEIVKIKSLAQLEKLTESIRYETRVLPKEAKAIIAANTEHRKEVKRGNPNEKFDFRLEWDAVQEYDATHLDIYAFKTASDTKDGIVLDFGNQCGGYPFSFHGKTFLTSERAYLCGQFSQSPNEELTGIQHQLLYEKNGYTAKKKVKNQNKHLIRSDWESFMADWMLYVVWHKCKGNKDFANKLRSLPRNAVIIENSTAIHERTNVYWGSLNKDIEDAREKVAKYAEMQYRKKLKEGNVEKKKKEELAKDIQQAADEIHYIGKYAGGHNCMGKILKMCQLALLDEAEPPINYELLREKQIYLFGELLTFGEQTE